MIKLLSHITLSALLLVSASGMTINLHYCHDRLYDLALITPAEDCCETGGHENLCQHDMAMDNSNHCDDETILLGSTSDYVVSEVSFSFEDAHSFELFFPTLLIADSQSIRESSATTLFSLRKPPLPQMVVLSQIQTFLI